MDGASKFVRGDAIAAIIITIINIIGGLAHRRGAAPPELMARPCRTYTLLTIGDGLVSQIPALLLSISTGLIVTRAASSDDMGADVAGRWAPVSADRCASVVWP